MSATAAALDDDRPPVALSVTMAPVANTTTRESHYLYTPELNLLVEATALGNQRIIDAEYIWSAGEPLAQIEPATNTVHYYFKRPPRHPDPDHRHYRHGRLARRARPAYGEIHTTRAGADRHQPLTFPGQEETSGEVRYNVFRWYRAGGAVYAG